MPDCIDNLLRTQDTPTAVVSRWIAAAGDPDYRDAFLTILKDPMTGHRDLINVKSRGAQGDATASRACDVCRYGVGCGFGVPIDLDPTILSTGLAGLTRFETSPTCAPRCCWLRLNSTSTTPSGSRALAQTSPGGILNIGGTGRLITTRRVQTATHGGDVLADIYTFKQPIAATRFMRTPSWRCTRTSSTRSTASWRRAARASLRSSGRVATVRCSASRFWSGQPCHKPHDHGSATSDLGSLVRLHHR
jgi:hypothetical protein